MMHSTCTSASFAPLELDFAFFRTTSSSLSSLELDSEGGISFGAAFLPRAGAAGVGRGLNAFRIPAPITQSAVEYGWTRDRQSQKVN
jgi:hypothetical protein